MTEALDFVSSNWRFRALGDGDPEVEENSAALFWGLVRISVALSALCFIIGSGAFAGGLLYKVPVVLTMCD